MATNKDIFEKTFGFEPVSNLMHYELWWKSEYRNPSTGKPAYSIDLINMKAVVEELRYEAIPKFINENFDNSRITPTVYITISDTRSALHVKFDDWNKGYYFDKVFDLYTSTTKEDIVEKVLKTMNFDFWMYKNWYSKLDDTEKLFAEGGPWTYEDRMEKTGGRDNGD